jgi:adenylate cyclase
MISAWICKYAHLWISIAVLLAAVALFRHQPQFLVSIRESLFDTYQRLQPRVPSGAPVRIIDIDEASLAHIGQWPWPRSRLAELVQTIQDLEATTIVLDILLAEPDRLSPSRLPPDLTRDPIGPAMGAARLIDHDELLAATLARGRVVTGFALVEASSTSIPALKAGFAFLDGTAPAQLPAAPGAVSSLPLIERAAAGNGGLSISLSAGGVIRQLPLLLQVRDQVLPSLSAEALRVAQGADTFIVRLTPPHAAVAEVRIGAFQVPTDGIGQVRLYAARPDPHRYLPAWKVLAGEVPADALQGTIAIVGSTARGLQDVHQTTLGDDVPGIEFHAQLLEQIIYGVYLRRPDWAGAAELLFLLTLSGVIVAVGSRIGPTTTAAIGVLAVASAFGASWAAFSQARLLLDPLIPAASLIAVYFSVSLVRHLQTERQQRWIRKAFASYISPKLVNTLVENPSQLQLGGERRELSFVFTDLEGFTALVEQHPPAVVVPALNQYLDGMIRVAFDFDGTVDKIIGDAVHVMFGAPIADPQHAGRAIACAIAIDRFACAFAERMRSQGLPFGRTRIGVNSGAAIVGNFGGLLRFDYTAHGDAINTAARLEGANRYLGTRICISEATTAQCPDFVGRPAGTLVLKGKTEPIRVFEPVADDADGPALEAYLEAYRMMQAENPGALDAFAALVEASPHDVLAALHLRRLQAGETGSLMVLAGK